MRSTLLTLLLVAAPAAVLAQATPAPTPTPTPRATAHHRMTGMISKDSATTIALAKVANATVTSSELEREHGKMIYSFDLTANAATVSVPSICHKIPNINTRLITDETAGISASLTITAAHPQSPVTRRILSPTDRRA